MSSDIAIKIENLSKCYQIYNTPRDRLKQFILPSLQRATGLQPQQYYREFWALRDISFEVKKGETVGVIGRNGGGKSTLLQLICGTLNPTSGTIQTNGRIAALLELGSGFNPEFTGRENVYLSCALLGLTKEETDARFDDVASFADIGSFIEQPVKTYSSGMFVRLAFAVNIVSQPDIMIVDEALAVGDMSFQAKCMTALRRIQDNGATVLFVSHDIGSIRSLCSQAAYLEKGILKGFGKASTLTEDYIRVTREELNSEVLKYLPEIKPPALNAPENSSSSPAALGFKESLEFDRRAAEFRYGVGGVKIAYAELVDSSDQPVVTAEFNQKVTIKIYIEAQEQTDCSVNYYIQDDKKILILGAAFRTIGKPLLHCKPGERYAISYSTLLPLQEGNYSIQIQISKPLVLDQSAEFLDVIDDAIVFNVQRRSTGRIWTKAYVENTIEVQQL
ncbi:MULTISPECIES: ABC transporter ATP-binding protein [unclassified Pseudomonas]|jgi:lipopolysaccharide transport system ATP-binding protein|uniref:ABC transporter ATP-binding protein n=1 Tax=unclassified Pseudomonas TaxID=196821 RepID=UPI00131FDEA2|nr:ABC transporter ATP-binding protein [Pseudomonas sp. R84]QHC96979.1 ABC transporter ATP-binding protein [Pseudomonas sp. R84]